MGLSPFSPTLVTNGLSECVKEVVPLFWPFTSTSLVLMVMVPSGRLSVSSTWTRTKSCHLFWQSSLVAPGALGGSGGLFSGSSLFGIGALQQKCEPHPCAQVGIVQRFRHGSVLVEVGAEQAHQFQVREDRFLVLEAVLAALLHRFLHPLPRCLVGERVLLLQALGGVAHESRLARLA